MQDVATKRARELHRVAGLKFRRQHLVDPYLADFACVLCKLIIEIDDGHHVFQVERAR
jgi:very-short-patch-repair endonuclease